MGGKALGGRKITNQEAIDLSKRIILEHKLNNKVSKILLCGSARRGKKQSGDLDFVFIDKNDTTKQWLSETFGYKKNGKPQTAGLIEGVQVEFYEATPETWGSSVLMWTGSMWSNIKLRKKAKEKGWKLSQHGLFEESVNLAKNKSEKEIFELLGTEYREPRYR